MVTMVFYTICHAIYNIYLHPLRAFPGPKLWFTSVLFRHVAAMRGRLDWDLQRFHERYGEVVRFSPDELSFIGEQAWRDIYGNRDHRPLEKDPAWYDVAKIADQATTVWTADGPDHVRLRRLLSPAFSDKALRDQEARIRSYVDLLVVRLRGLARAGQPVDMVQWYNFTTFDIIGDLALGKPFGCLRGGRYHGWVKGLFDAIKIGPFTRTVSAYTDVRTVLGLLAPTALREAWARHAAYVADAARERVQKGVMAERRDFLSYILQTMREDNAAAHGQGQGQGDAVTDQEIAANCSFFLIAGSETVATALSGITYHLLRNPDVLETLVAEIRSAFAREDDITLASTGATPLPYLQACIAEGLRLYPPGPSLLPRRTPRGETIDIAGYPVPGWTAVGVHVLSATRSAQNFHAPERFLPERWLGPSAPASPFRHDRRGASQPFGTGPRACLGKSLAYHEMRLILARILWGFDLELCGGAAEAWDRQRVYTLWEKGALMCRLRVRDGGVGEDSESCE
ncbi:hypothetical protein VTN02DRAFT_5958 [Thermoascus thermophilus]